jgi:hypothetical protein
MIEILRRGYRSGLARAGTAHAPSVRRTIIEAHGGEINGGDRYRHRVPAVHSSRAAISRQAAQAD